ncbi:MAG: phosphoglycerate dehydrogenase [Planctomycetes bacterium]|nr:phosphoglycerate dehydrogenase [Planctomycetota bacterium]
MKTLIADKFEQDGIEQLKAVGCSISQDVDLQEESLALALSTNGVELLIVRSTVVTGEMITAASSLKLIIRAGSGTNNIDTKTAKECGVPVANCPGMNAVAVAELAMGLMLALDRHIVDNVNDLRAGIWNKKKYSKAQGLFGRTLGVVGLGKIGHLLAERAHAFGMKIVYSDVVANTAAESDLGAEKIAFEQVLARGDFVSLHVPLLEETRGMMNAERFKMMKSTAHLINCSRGEVVNSADLVAAIEGGDIAGAGLDVYENEPGPSDKTFADAAGLSKGVYGTHHIGASTDQAQEAVGNEVVRIVEHFKKSGETLNRVNG